MWKCMVIPSTLMLEEICLYFFHHISPNSHLHDLGCQRLAADLTARHEGAQHLYHPSRDGDGNDKENPNVEEDDLHILKVISPNFEGNLGDHSQRVVQDLPKCIPMIFVI